MKNRPVSAFAAETRREDAAVFGLLVVLLRSLRGWNQEQAAQASGVHPSQISVYELWKAVPTEATLKRLARAARVPWFGVREVLPALRALYRAVTRPVGKERIPYGEAMAACIGGTAAQIFIQDIEPFLDQRLPALTRVKPGELASVEGRLEDERIALGLLIVLLRSLRHWTQEELSQASGVGRGQISSYERAKTLPRQSTLEQLATAVGVALPDARKVLPALARFVRAESEQHAAPSSLAKQIGWSAADAFLLTVEPFVVENCPALAGKAVRQEARRAAVLRVKELLSWPPAKRWRAVEKLAAYRTWAVAERTAFESEKRAPHDADEALEVARLAVRMAELTEDRDLNAIVGGVCWAFVGNALRVKGKFPDSDEAFIRSDRLLEAGASADPGGLFDMGLLLELKASLRRHQGRFEESLDLLKKATLASRSEGVMARILLVRSATLEQMGDSQGAIEALEEARPLVEREGCLRDRFGLEFNFSASLADAGRYQEAERLLPAVQRLAAQLGNDLDLIRVSWLRAKVLEGLGKIDEAIGDLEWVQGEFASRGIPFDTARACLDLAALYLQQGRTAEVKRLADEMVEIFRAQQVHREALAAVLVFQKAVEQERATVELARRLSDYLRRAQHEPELRFGG